MPTIAIIDGVRIVIYPKDHLPPHIHVFFGGAEMQISIATGRVLNGRIAKSKMRLIDDWLDANRPYAAYMWKRIVTRRSEDEGAE